MSCEKFHQLDTKTVLKLECGPMPNVIVALLNIGGAHCSTPQSLVDAHYQSTVPVEICWGGPNSPTDLSR